MVNLRAEDSFISNDNTKQVAVEPCSIRWYQVTSDNVKPGMPVKRVAGTSTGIVETATADSGLQYIFGVAELDKNQIWDCTTGYTDGDLIPVIPFHENKGKLLRNLFGLSGIAQEKDMGFCVGETGFLGISTDERVDTTSVPYVRAYDYKAAQGADYRFIGRVV